MEKPVIFAVDDDASVLAAVARDLRRHYGANYDVMRAGPGAEALEELKQLKLESRAVARRHASGKRSVRDALRHRRGLRIHWTTTWPFMPG